MVPKRDETTRRLLSSFMKEMSQQKLPLACIEEGAVPGQDDWDEDDESQQVECWWGIFRRKQSAE